MRARTAVASAFAVTLLGVAGAVPAAAHHPSVTEYPTTSGAGPWGTVAGGARGRH